ncbi:hypothetical protein PF003_g8879 [Phytophthora fragariae]|nr:hypothetical protein PF003_g8879 [Phytophthora fragariae]
MACFDLANSAAAAAFLSAAALYPGTNFFMLFNFDNRSAKSFFAFLGVATRFEGP